MARPKKKYDNPESAMDELLNRAVTLFIEPYDDRDERKPDLPSLRSVAEALGTTILRTRKLLITAGYFSTETARTVQEMTDKGYTIEEIIDETGLKRASINSYLPYKNLAFNLDQTTVNADRHKVFRRRVKAVDELHSHIGMSDESLYLWRAVIAFEDYPFYTWEEREKFSYKISENVKEEECRVEGCGSEIVVNGIEKSIPRETVILAYKRAREMNVVQSAGALGIPEYGRYLYSILLRLGVCRAGTVLPQDKSN